MDDEIQILIIRYTWEISFRESFVDHNVLPGTCSFKCKRKPDWMVRKIKARYCVRWGVQKILSPEPLHSYYPVVQWDTVSLMLILQCILGLQSQSIDFTNAFSWADIPSGKLVEIEFPRNLKSDGGQFDVVLILNKSIYSQAKDARLWYEKFQKRSLDRGL